jgi:hypothetical protein
MSHPICAKCGNNADWAVVDLCVMLCIDCEAAFGEWCRMMDLTHIEYHYSEFMEAA